MTNPAIGWMKEHPAITASVAGGIGLIVYLMSRSGGSGLSTNLSAVANSQVQQAQLANQNAAVQAQATVQQNTAAYAAQVANNQTDAALAATIAQYQANTATATLAAGVQNNQTAAAENVANTKVNAELTAYQLQTGTESDALKNEFAYLMLANNNQTSLNQSAMNIAAPGVSYQIAKGNNASQSSAYSFLEALLNKTQASVATAQGATYVELGNQSTDASIINNEVSAASNAFSSLLKAFA